MKPLEARVRQLTKAEQQQQQLWLLVRRVFSGVFAGLVIGALALSLIGWSLLAAALVLGLAVAGGAVAGATVYEWQRRREENAGN